MGQKILVVEDNELNLRLFCDLLRAHGYEAEPVRDGRDAVVLHGLTDAFHSGGDLDLTLVSKAKS